MALPAESGEKYVASGRVLFRRFPDAQRSFALKTAARMSASFPYILPAVSLPTDPPARIVDAGYYDNFGVNLAAAWAYANRKWIIANTSGLALIQINAFPRGSQAARRRRRSTDIVSPLRGLTPRGRGARDGRRRRRQEEPRLPSQWLTSPLEGGAAARDWSMYYRNEEQLRLLDDTFNANGGRLFERFNFTNRGHAAMNVIINKEDIDAMRRDFDASPAGGAGIGDDNYREMRNLVTWWNGGLIDREARTLPPAPTERFRRPKLRGRRPDDARRRLGRAGAANVGGGDPASAISKPASTRPRFRQHDGPAGVKWGAVAGFRRYRRFDVRAAARYGSRS